MRLTFCWRKRGQVAHRHRENSDNPENRRPDCAKRRKHLVDDAQQERESCCLGRGRHERNNRRGSTLVNVRRPDVERSSGHLEENSNQHQGKCGMHERLILSGRHVTGDFIYRGRPSGAEHHGNAVEQERSGKGSKQKIFDCGFRSADGLLAISRKNIGGDRGDLQGNKDHQQFNRAGHQAHTDGAERHKRVILALVVTVSGQAYRAREAT